MLQKILLKIGYVPVVNYVHADDFRRMVEQKEKENLVLRIEAASLKGKSESKPVFDVSLGDPTPTDTDARKAYVAQVAGFFKGVMEPKVNYMISVTHKMLEEAGSDRDFDLILKGVVYSFREFLKWGEVMVNEQVANQIETRSEDIEQAQQILKDKLNEQ